jgi:ubiquinone/menaquinone biosynthesis C-methylase UbiE
VNDQYLERLKLYDQSYYQRMHGWSLKEKYQVELNSLLQHMNIQPSDRVLDVGCSTGNAIKYLISRYGCWAVGLDYPADWIQFCQIRPAVRGTASMLPFQDSSFDKVLMIHVIGHLPKPHEAISEIGRILRPGGLLGLITPNALFVYLMKPLNYMRIIHYIPDPTVLRYYRLHSLRSLFRDSVFHIEQLYPFGKLPNLISFASFNSNLRVIDIFRERLICVVRKI